MTGEVGNIVDKVKVKTHTLDSDFQDADFLLSLMDYLIIGPLINARKTFFCAGVNFCFFCDLFKRPKDSTARSKGGYLI